MNETCCTCCHDVGFMIDEIKRLRAIVDKLPTTVDGVPIVPGTDVWRKCSACHHVHPWRSYDRPDFSTKVLAECYSTREAAEAAKEER